MQHYLIPSWPKPRQVTAVCTLRTGGYSQPPFDSFNCADHVGDLTYHVKYNRDKLSRDWQLTHPMLVTTNPQCQCHRDTQPSVPTAG